MMTTAGYLLYSSCAEPGVVQTLQALSPEAYV